MRMISVSVGVACFSAVCATFTHAQPTIPIRELLPPDATAADRFGNIFNAREIANGRVLVNDGIRRQLSVLDNKLANRTVLLDSIAEGAQGYGARPVPLVPHLADSTFMPDQASRTLLVIDPAGKIARVASVPKSGDFLQLTAGTAGVDWQGNLIYRAVFPVGPATIVNGVAVRPPPPDTAPIVRARFETRTVDTVGAIRIEAGLPVTSIVDSAGRRRSKVVRIPLLTIDEFSVLADGSVAMVRGHDYHVDIIQPDGKKISGPKLPFDFRRLTDAEKQAIVDSAKAAESVIEAKIAALPPRPVGRGIAPVTSLVPLPPDAVNPNRPLTEIAPISALPDYYPPIRLGATKPDADGNLWILPTTSARSLNGELVYDVVSNRGTMIERVRLPVGRSIAGFGRGGVIYLMSKGSDGLWTLERTRVARQN